MYQAEGLPKNISIEEFFDKRSDKSITWTSQAAKPSAAQNTEFFASKATRGRADFPTFETWYKKTHKKVYPVTVTGNPAEDVEIQTEVEKVSEESKVHDPVRHPFKYPTDRVSSINKKISINIKFPDGMKISKTGISFTELKHLIERLEVVC